MPETTHPAGPATTAPVTYPHGFARLDNRIVTHYGKRIGVHGVALYCALAVHADNTTRTCFPSVRTISRLLMVSQRKVLKTIQVLEATGLVRVVRTRSAQGRRHVNLYTLLPIADGQAPVPNDVEPPAVPASAPLLHERQHPAVPVLAELDLINKTQINNREGVPEAPAHAPAAHLEHPAVKAYRGACRLTPNETQRAAIATTVTDLAQWTEVVQRWLLAGYRKQNVAGMLDWYRNGIPGRDGIPERDGIPGRDGIPERDGIPAGSGGHGRSAAGGWAGGRLGFQGNRPGEWRESRPPETPEETARLDAEWEVYVREARERSQRGAA